ncbi:hypothetical protein NPIL_633491 [Nephila pilipes]|uniref:Uncharacterized protein n=1 Tax=Nephila pilipes TaxID=299642 RepID=A0A8X6MHG9_NEPPI|nr:hypothetical protein NPIL_633491 [Nephila pilipes]
MLPSKNQKKQTTTSLIEDKESLKSPREDKSRATYQDVGYQRGEEGENFHSRNQGKQEAIRGDQRGKVDPNIRFHGTNETFRNLLGDKHQRRYDASGNDEDGERTGNENAFRYDQDDSYQRRYDYIQKSQNNAHLSRYHATQSDQSHRYQEREEAFMRDHIDTNDSLLRDQNSKYQRKNQEPQQNKRYLGNDEASRSESNVKYDATVKDRNRRYLGNDEASRSDPNVKYDATGKDRNSRYQRRNETSQSDPHNRNQRGHESSLNNPIDRYETYDVYRNDQNRVRDGASQSYPKASYETREVSRNYLSESYQSGCKSTGNNNNGRHHTKDKTCRIDLNYRYHEKGGAFQKGNEAFLQRKEKVINNQHVYAPSQTGTNDTKHLSKYRCPSENQNPSVGTSFSNLPEPASERIVVMPFLKMISHSKPVEKHPLLVISQSQRRAIEYPKLMTPHLVKTRRDRISETAAKSFPNVDTTVFESRRLTWPLNVKLVDSHSRYSTEKEARVLENDAKGARTKGYILQKTQILNLWSTMPVTKNAEKKGRDIRETSLGEIKFLNKRPGVREIHETKLNPSQARESNIQVRSKNEFENERIMQQSKRTDITNRKSKIIGERNGLPVLQEDSIVSRQFKGSMPKVGSLIEKIPRETASNDEILVDKKPKHSFPRKTWTHLRGLSDKYSRMRVPRDSKMADERTNRVAHPVERISSRQQRSSLSHDPRFGDNSIGELRYSTPRERCIIGQQVRGAALLEKDAEQRMRKTRVPCEADVENREGEIELQQARTGDKPPRTVLSPADISFQHDRRQQRPSCVGILDRLLRESRISISKYCNIRSRRPISKYYKCFCIFANHSP